MSIIDGGVAKLHEILGQILSVLGDDIPLFVGGNVRAGAVESRVNNVIKSPYSLGPAL